MFICQLEHRGLNESDGSSQPVCARYERLPFMFGVIYSTVKACVSRVPHDMIFTKNEGEDTECLSSALLLSYIYFQVAVLSQAKFRYERPPYSLSKHWQCNLGQGGEGEVPCKSHP